MRLAVYYIYMGVRVIVYHIIYSMNGVRAHWSIWECIKHLLTGRLENHWAQCHDDVHSSPSRVNWRRKKYPSSLLSRLSMVLRANVFRRKTMPACEAKNAESMFCDLKVNLGWLSHQGWKEKNMWNFRIWVSFGKVKTSNQASWDKGSSSASSACKDFKTWL